MQMINERTVDERRQKPKTIPADESRYRADPDRLRKQLIADAVEWIRHELHVTRAELVEMIDNPTARHSPAVDESTLVALAAKIADIQSGVARLAANERQRIRATPPPVQRPTGPGSRGGTDSYRQIRERARVAIRENVGVGITEISRRVGVSITTLQRARIELSTGKWPR